MFHYDPSFAFEHAAEVGTFADLVSASAEDRTFFEFGIYEGNAGKAKKKLGPDVWFYRFREMDGMPHLSLIARVRKGWLAQVNTDPDGSVRFRSFAVEGSLGAMDVEEVFSWIQTMTDDESEMGHFSTPPKEMGPGFPAPYYLDHAFPKGARSDFSSFDDRGMSHRVTWVAPIRTAPKRFYGGARAAYSPDGEHTPYVLRQVMEGPRAKRFASNLKAFGEASGLFDTVEAHTFGDDPHAPFELLVNFSGAKLSINNVGYGVSQVLPLAVEFISGMKGSWFAVQQPEVHLHPRAQAALGGLMYELAREREFSFFVETHSDFLIDRFRLTMQRDTDRKVDHIAQVIFFTRDEDGNHAHAVRINQDGRYESDQPDAFREFFIREELSMLDL